MDIALEYFTEAEQCVDSLLPISLADAFFEDSDDAKATVEHNEKLHTKAINAIKNGIKVLIDKVNELIKRIKDFFQRQFLSADEKAKYKKFRQMVKSNPEFGKQIVTIEDFRAYEKLYDDAIKQLEKEGQKENPSNEVANKILNVLMDEVTKLGDAASGVGKRALLSTALSTAVDIADKNTTCAKAINLALQTELISLKEVEKELGEKDAARFEKKISKLAKKGFIHRWKVKVFQKKEATLEAILRKQVKKFLSFTNLESDGMRYGQAPVTAGSVLKGMTKNPKLTSDMAGGPKNAAKAAKAVANAGVEAHMLKKQAKKNAKNAKQVVNDVKSLLGR